MVASHSIKTVFTDTDGYNFVKIFDPTESKLFTGL